MDRERRSGWLLAMMAGIVVGLIAFGMIYVNRQVAASERRDCGDKLAEIRVYEAIPPSTETGQAAWVSKVARYRQIGCEPPVVDPPVE